MTSLFGLPAHPFLAHVPIVLIPLGAIGAIAMCWKRLRDKVGWVTVGVVFVAGIFCQLAISAGESLEEYVRETNLVRDHAEMGESIRPWVLLMFLGLLAVMVVDRLRTRNTGQSSATGEGRDGGRTDQRLRVAGVVALVIALVFSAVSVVSIVRIGHSGSKAVWDKTQQRIDKGATENEGGEEGEG